MQPILLRLREKAHHALYQYHADAGRRFGIAPPAGRLSSVVTRKTSRDELVVLGGSMSRLLDGSWEEPPVLSTTRMARPSTQPLTISLPSPSAPTSPKRVRLVSGALTDHNTSPASILPDNDFHVQGANGQSTNASAGPVNSTANPILSMGKRPSGSVSPSSSASEPGGSAAASLMSGSDWANALSMDTLSNMATQAEWTSLMGLGGEGSRKPVAGLSDSPFFGGLPMYHGQGNMGPQTSNGLAGSHISGVPPLDGPDLAPSMFSAEGLAALPSSSDMNVDFDISADMRTNVFDDSLLPLQMGEDATVVEAWRTFFQDPRFFNHDAFDMPLQ